MGSFKVHDRRIIKVRRFSASGVPTSMRSDHQWMAYDVETPGGRATFRLSSRTGLCTAEVTQPMCEEAWKEARSVFESHLQQRDTEHAWRVLSDAFVCAMAKEDAKAGLPRSERAKVCKQENRTAWKSLGEAPQIVSNASSLHRRIAQVYKEPWQVRLKETATNNVAQQGKRENCEKSREILWCHKARDLHLLTMSYMNWLDSTNKHSWQSGMTRC